MTIGDKKVAVNLSDGVSVNLNKPTVLDSTVTSFLGLKNGEYCGVCTYSTPEYNADIFRSSIMDFPFPIFRKGTEATGSYNSNYYYAECPTDVNFYLKVMDFVGDDNRNTQLYALQLRGANEDPVAGEYVDFPANGWDNGLYIGRSYYDDPAPLSLNDKTNNESTDRVENNKIAWVLVPDQAVIKDMLPYIQDDTYHLDNNGVSISDKNSVASARVADYLADGINPRELSNGADLNKCLKVGKYGMDGITVVNGPVAVTIDGSVHYMDAANVGTNTPTTPTMNNAIMTVEMTGYVPRVANTTKLIQTIVSNEFTVRRVISGLKGTSTLDVINTAEKATTFGPWVSLVEDNLTSTSTTSALSANQGKVLKDTIKNLDDSKLSKGSVLYRGAHYDDGSCDTVPSFKYTNEIKDTTLRLIDYAANSDISGTYSSSTINDITDPGVYRIQGNNNLNFALSDFMNTDMMTREESSYISDFITLIKQCGCTVINLPSTISNDSGINVVQFLIAGNLDGDKILDTYSPGAYKIFYRCSNTAQWHPLDTFICNSLDSDSEYAALSASQGKVLNESKMNAPIYSSTDLTPGVSDLANGQIYIVYYN